MGGAAGIIGFPRKPLDQNSPRDRVVAAIGMIVEVRLTASLGVSIDELYEKDEAGRWFDQCIAWSSGLPQMQELVQLCERQASSPQDIL